MDHIVSRPASELDGTDIAAVVLSVLIPGLGHIMLGQKTKGLVIFLLVLASCGVGYLLSALIALDAYLLARARRERRVGDWELFPERHAY